jgi:hypothetical protein
VAKIDSNFGDPLEQGSKTQKYTRAALRMKMSMRAADESKKGSADRIEDTKIKHNNSIICHFILKLDLLEKCFY